MKILYKKFILKNTKSVLLASLMLISCLSFASLSGTYTVNAGAAASSTNYKSLSAIFGDMYNGSRSDGGTSNGSGVSGAVVINVVSGSGPYTEQVVVYQITGVSSTNTITVNGNGETLQYSASSSSNNATLLLNGADYVTIDNLVILANSSSDGRCVHLYNDARSNTISNCNLRMPNMTGTSQNNAYIALTQGTSNMTTYGNAGMDNTFTKNKMSSVTSGGPYYGITIADQSSGTTVRKNTISNNSLNDFRYYGIWTYYGIQQTITGNEIFNDATSSYTNVMYGMYNYCYYKGGDYTITDNYIHDLSSYVSSTMYGIYHYAYYGVGSSDINILRNKIVFKNRSSSSFGLYLYGYQSQISGNYNISNNFIDIECTNTSYSYGLYSFGAYYMTYFKSHAIESNYVRLKSAGSGYGIYAYCYYNQNFTKRASISNNIVDLQLNNYGYGIYCYAYSNNMPVDVCYNTIHTSGYTSGTVSGYKYNMYIYYVDGKIHNNSIVSFDNGGTTYGIYDYYSTGTFSNNNLWDAGLGSTYTFGMRNGTSSNSFNDYKNNFADANGVNQNPKFKDIPNQDFKPSSFNFVNKGVPVTGFTTDYAGVTRNATTPDIGALEYFVDVALTRFNFNGINVCGGYKEAVTVTFKNLTNDTLKNVPVKYTVTGKLPVKGTVPKISPNDTVVYTFQVIAEFNGSGVNTIIVELDGSDDDLTNNSLSRNVNVTPSPAGFEMVESSTFPGYFRPGKSGGNILNPDATIPGLKVKYEIAPNTTTGYTNSNYGSKWTISGTSFKTKNGTTVTGPVYTAPSGGNNATLEFDPSSSYIDSLIYLNLFVKNLNTNCDSSFGRWIYIPHIPQTSFTASNVCLGDVAVFNNTSKLLKGTPLYRWKFNNPSDPGDTSTIIDPVYDYTSYGIYMVELIAYNSAFPKFTVKYTNSITVTPVPSIDFKVLNACENVPVSFTNNTSLPIPGTITYVWDFGDPLSNVDNSTAKEPKWTYSNPGGYKVKLRATANGCSAELTKNANQFSTPSAKFSYPSVICDKVDIKFTNGSTIKVGNMGYYWNFGDGGISTAVNPLHTFANATSKTIKLKVTSEFGCLDSVSHNI
ncbi:MAG: PKD domain-containing protein, partial [Bacteroidia bacterium]|nr:PKD domain-containing protein [Bacteroidia bacterium]